MSPRRVAHSKSLGARCDAPLTILMTLHIALRHGEKKARARQSRRRENPSFSVVFLNFQHVRAPPRAPPCQSAAFAGHGGKKVGLQFVREACPDLCAHAAKPASSILPHWQNQGQNAWAVKFRRGGVRDIRAQQSGHGKLRTFWFPLRLRTAACNSEMVQRHERFRLRNIRGRLGCVLSCIRLGECFHPGPSARCDRLLRSCARPARNTSNQCAQRRSLDRGNPRWRWWGYSAARAPLDRGRSARAKHPVQWAMAM